MIDLEPLDAVEDLTLVRGLLERHVEYTGSTVAARLLEDWPAAARQFVKVMPKELRRVLNERARELERQKDAPVAVGDG
jgi:glutamate synthase domain-containing protein 3